jgi:hypothetical protein
MRITAKKLLRHPWMQSARKALTPSSNETQAKINAPTPSKPLVPRQTSGSNSSSRRVPTPIPATEKDQVKSVASSAVATGAGGDTLRATKPVTVYCEAVQRVQQWNQALNG